MAYIHHIETIVPETAYEQSKLADLMERYLPSSTRTKRLINQMYKQADIDKRYSVIQDLFTDDSLFFSQGQVNIPSTKTRNEQYIQEAKRLFVHVADQAIKNTSDIEISDISHVITVSCTGFFSPGPDYFIVEALGLSTNTERYHVGFMGCYAAFPALKMANAFCQADPEAVVLIVCLELCSLHLQNSVTPDNLIAASLFSDGGAAVVLTSQKPQGTPALRLKKFANNLITEGENDMAWTLGNTGFEMTLSSYVPKLLGSHIKNAVQALLDPHSLETKHIAHWAIHPGGRAILDNVQNALNLCPQHLLPSREVLKHYGNMSSASILFVLKRILQQEHTGTNDLVHAMAFGPGISVESSLMQLV